MTYSERHDRQVNVIYHLDEATNWCRRLLGVMGNDYRRTGTERDEETEAKICECRRVLEKIEAVKREAEALAILGF